MRKKLISLILVGLGVLVLVGGILSATVFKQDSKVTLTTPKMGNSPYVTLSAEVLALVDDSVEVTATVPNNGGLAFIVGRTSDIVGWLGSESSYAVSGASDWSSLTVKEVAGSAAPVGDDASSTEGEIADDTKSTDSKSSEKDTEATKKDKEDADASASPDAESDDAAANESEDEPASSISTESDMWITHVVGEGSEKIKLAELETGMSLLAVATDEDAAAPAISAQWERSVTTPLLVPAIILGVALAVLGLLLMWMPSKAPKKSKKKTLGTPIEKAIQKSSSSSSEPQPERGGSSATSVETSDSGRWNFPAGGSSQSTQTFGGQAQPTGTASTLGQPHSPSQPFTAPQAQVPAQSAAQAQGSQQLAQAVSSAFQNAAESSKLVAFSPTEAVTPVPPARRGGSHASAYSHGSAESASSAASVPSAASIARAVAQEPDLNTAQIRQLGLTRRQLREMRQTSNPTAPTPEVSAHLPAHTPMAPQAPTSPITAAQTADVSIPSSRTTSSNWRAAWGVRQGGEETGTTQSASWATNAGTSEAHQAHAGVEEHRGAGSQFGAQQQSDSLQAYAQRQASQQQSPAQQSVPRPANQSSQQEAATPTPSQQASPWSPQQAQATVQQPHTSGAATPSTEAARDLRAPASWWGNNEAVAPAPATQPANDLRQSRSEATRASVRSAASSHSAAQAPSARSAAATAGQQAPARPRAAAAGTRRALYSSYRSDAERLSAQEDWPVPAPPKFEDVDGLEGDK